LKTLPLGSTYSKTSLFPRVGMDLIPGARALPLTREGAGVFRDWTARNPDALLGVFVDDFLVSVSGFEAGVDDAIPVFLGSPGKTAAMRARLLGERAP